MWYVAGAGVVLALLAAAGFAGGKTASAVKTGTVDRIIDSASIKSLSMQQVNWLLARLESQPAPDTVWGAMCYQAVASPVVAEYICPVCGEKTVYNCAESAFSEWELQACRRMIESINSRTEFRVELDETLFCEFCTPEESIGNCGLFLVVRPEEGRAIVNGVTEIDLRMLDSFLQGNLFYTTENEGRIPLLEYADRMRELLGLTEE